MIKNFVTSTAFFIHKSILKYEAMIRLKSALSTLDFRTKGELPKGFFEIGEHIGLPKIPRKVLFRLIGQTINFEPIRVELKKLGPFSYNLKDKPLKHQEGIINDAIYYFNSPDAPFDYGKRLSINLGAGLGKTYIASNIISQLNVKFLFLVNSSRVAEQAYKELSRFLKPHKNRFLLVTNGGEMQYPPEDLQGIFMTHAMFKSVVKRYGIEHISKVLQEDLKIQMKIMDEFDMEVTNMYFMDVMFNFRYNLYLTATQFKSIHEDDRLFQLIYSDIKVLGRDVVMEQRKDIHLIRFKSNPSPGEFYKISMRDDMFKIMYNNILGLKDIQLDYVMETFYLPENSLFKEILKEEGQIAFYCGRIETCEVVKKKLIDNYNIDPNDIGILNSKISGDANIRKMKSKPFLMTTCQSMGRGVDSDMLRCLVYLEFSFSLSQLMQSVARVGRVGKKYGHVIYPVDFSFSKVINAYEKLKKNGFFKNNFKNIKFYTIDEEKTKDRYIYGYRKDSELGKAIWEKEKEKRMRRIKLSKLLKN